MPALVVGLALAAAFRFQDPKVFSDALQQGDEKAAAAALESLLGRNDAQGVRGFHQALVTGLRIARDLAREEQKRTQEFEDKRLVRGPDGGYVRGNAVEEVKAREALDIARRRVAVADDILPRIGPLLGRLTSDSAISEIIAQMGSAGDPYWRAHAILAAGRLKDDRAVAAMTEMLSRERELLVRMALLAGLAPRVATNLSLQDAFLEMARDRHWSVQIQALESLREGLPRPAASPLITALRGSRTRVRWACNDALVSLTRVDKNADYEAWRAWWDENGQDFVEGRYAAPAGERAPERGQSVFYGIPIQSDNLVVLMDASSSMLQPSSWKPPADHDPFTGKTRIDAARYEMKRLIRGLSDGTRVALARFHADVLFSEERALPLDRGYRARSEKWIDGFDIGSGTSTYNALRAAFDRAGGSWNDAATAEGPDTIVLVTDGDPTGRVAAAGLFVEKIRALNLFKRIAIHCIAISPTAGGRELLQTLAAGSGGRYHER